MMMSLFSMFDPSSIMFIQLNWITLFIVLIMYPMSYWTMNSRTINTFFVLNKHLHNEFTMLFNNKILIKGSTILSVTLFCFILINNMSSNFPYTFCCSAHLVFSMSMSIPIWMSIILFSWTTLTKTMFSHLVPNGTPTIIMPLMVMIETISNLIRPMALAVRLTANLIAGHLLMTLLGNSMNLSSSYWYLILIVQMSFMMFELMVATIQSYVFSVLMTLYSSEIN
uniref:ATP synthase subunit a n=1 Tax=Homotoma ficus TaxID=2218120 RepID=A0A344A2E8_9HEMI|nr:ATP synthase F0 subunit 6 [Homotoma ficus]AWU48939.1 ATP synthase F0 subunit 6 [Homotoma ficus]